MIPPQNKPPRSVLIAARLITVLVGLAGAEALFWSVGYPRWWAMDPSWGGASPEYECDQDLGWKARQGSFDLAWAGQRPAHYTNWSGGRRATAAKEPGPEAANRPQALFFGDSFVQGYQLSDSETLPWIVQKNHPELNVSNFGAGNFGTFQSYLAIKKWVRGPSSVYYLFNGFHEVRNAADRDWLRIFKKAPPGCYYPYAELSGDRLQERRSEGNLVWPLSRRLRLVAMVQEYKDIFESYQRVRDKRKITEMLLTKMNQTVQGERGKFTVVLFDMSGQERKDYRQFLDSQAIRYVNCDGPEMADKNLRLPDGHPGKGLNEKLAEWLEPIDVPSPMDKLISAKAAGGH